MKWPGASPTVTALGTAALGTRASDREGVWNLKDCPRNPSWIPHPGSSHSEQRRGPLLCSVSLFLLSTLPGCQVPQHLWTTPCTYTSANVYSTVLDLPVNSTFRSSYTHSQLHSLRTGTGLLCQDILMSECWFPKVLSK